MGCNGIEPAQGCAGAEWQLGGEVIVQVHCSKGAITVGVMVQGDYDGV